ncbi:TPA: host cell division inhibitor Icd-like protein [Salmonella enterica]
MRNNRPLVLVDKNRLPAYVAGLYIPCVAPHRATGFSSLTVNADSRDNSVTRSFCVRSTTLTRRIMAGCNGGALALAGFVYASLLTRLRPATPFSSALARSEKPVNEAVTMVNANPCPYPLFIWLFAAVSRADLTDHTPHMVRITAPDELTARRSLVGRYVLSFAGRIPTQEVRHV